MANTEWQERVGDNFVYIVENMNPEGILDRLLKMKAISEGKYTQLRRIKDNKCDQDCNRELLTNVLNKRGPDSVKDFVQMLEDTQQQHIADKIRQSKKDSPQQDAEEIDGDARLTDPQIEAVAKAVTDKDEDVWNTVGHRLGFSESDLEKYRMQSKERRLNSILKDWMRWGSGNKRDLMSACKSAGVGDAAGKALK